MDLRAELGAHILFLPWSLPCRHSAPGEKNKKQILNQTFQLKTSKIAPGFKLAS